MSVVAKYLIPQPPRGLQLDNSDKRRGRLKAPDRHEIAGVFFDVDDTLVAHTTARVAAAQESWQVVMGDIPPPQAMALRSWQAYQETFGSGAAGFAEAANLTPEEITLRVTAQTLAALSLEVEGLAERLTGAYLAAEARLLQSSPGAVQALSALRERGLLTGVITNGPGRVQREKLAALGLLPLLDIVVVDTEFGLSKPDPAIFGHAADLAGLSADRLLFVGDNHSLDVCGALAAGWTSVQVCPSESEKLQSPAAHYTIRSLWDLFVLHPLRRIYTSVESADAAEVGGTDEGF